MKAVGGVALLLVISTSARAQPPLASAQDASAAIAFVNVSVVPMDRDGVLPRQTVVVRGDRIAAVGPAGDVAIPDDALIIHAAGKFLLPGLTDAHVHLPGTVFARTRPDFGDAPLYLAFGITSVVNLGGSTTELEWKRRVQAGDLSGPTIYTSGPFVNEPRVTTVEEVHREVDAHVRDGYDVLKFREVMDATGRTTATTRGLSRPAYEALIDTARAARLPLVGHAPVNLGLDALLAARQHLAHSGALSNIYFLPLVASPRMLVATGAAIALLVTIVTAWALSAIAQRWRTSGRATPDVARRGRRLARGVLAAALLALAAAALVLPGGPLFESHALRLLFTAAAALIAVLAVLLGLATVQTWRDRRASVLVRWPAALGCAAALTLASTLGIFWVPLVWRSSNRGITQVAQRVRASGLSVQTTLINYEILSGPERAALIRDPAIAYLADPVRTRWRALPPAGNPGYAYHRFMKKVVGALHAAGVPLVAGTDAMGVPLVVPGASLHRELQLLIECGLTPYEALRAATVSPAAFLGKADEFGTVTAGKRADLLLVDEDPLHDLAHVKRPTGVMVRGRWMTRAALDGQLATLAAPPGVVNR